MIINPIQNLHIQSRLPLKQKNTGNNNAANTYKQTSGLPNASIINFTSNIKNVALPQKQYKLDGKRILITGATGTLGRALIDELFAQYNIKEVIVFSRDEFKQHEMKQHYGKSPRIKYVIGDVRNADSITKAAKNADVIIHTAAMKHVSVCEENPEEAILTNINGAKNVINAALNNNVARVIAISTDKAVEPENLYGATKLISEKLFTHANKYAKDTFNPTSDNNTQTAPRFCNIRLGNILGSRGSVLGIFKEQSKKGQLTVTNPHMTRFFISPKQAAQQVLSSIEIMRGGEIFVPKIKSTDILSLAKKTAPNCKIKVVGAGTGEKIHETLIPAQEQDRTLEFGDRYVILPETSYAKHDSGSPFLSASDNERLRFSDEELQNIIDECIKD